MTVSMVALRGVVASGIAAAVLALAACTPEDINIDGHVKCERDAAGKVTCSYEPAGEPPITTPPTTPPPTTEPPVTEPPVTDEPAPVDPNEGLPAAEMVAESLDGQARVVWSTERTDITGWYVERDGRDTSGYGVWGTDLPADAREFRFDLLRNGDQYTVTLVGKTATGDLEPVKATVIPVAPSTPPTTEPPVTEPPVSEPPPTTPPAPSGTTAAERHGWGAPIASASDEFNYTGRPDSAKWHQAGECWAGHAGNGKRCASNSNVMTEGGNGFLRQTGEANGDTGWLANKLDQRYGKWEARVRSQGAGSGSTYHPLLIIWPQSDRWPGDGEYDFWENQSPNGTCAGHFIHYPHPRTPVQQEGGWCKAPGVNLNEWHNVAIEWTPDHVRGFIDGVEWFKYSGGAGPNGRANIQDMPSGHLTIQLDNFHGSGMQPASYDVDWVRVYR